MNVAAVWCRVLSLGALVQIELGNLGWRITDDDVVQARIDSEPEIEYDRVPLLVIDGKDITWEEFGRMLTYDLRGI